MNPHRRTARIKHPPAPLNGAWDPKAGPSSPSVCLSIWCRLCGCSCHFGAAASLPTCVVQGRCERKQGQRRGRDGSWGEGRHSTEQSFFIIHWDFSADRLPELLVSESLLLHDSAQSVIWAGYCWWKNVLPALECILKGEQSQSHLLFLFQPGSRA